MKGSNLLGWFSFSLNCQSMVRSISSENSWQAGTVVANALPVYLDGIAGISYWECKVLQNGTAAGFIIFNANKIDIILPVV